MTIAAAAVFGLLVGSFLNVVIHRVPARASLARPPSACPRCGQPIRPRDNIPILSWVLLRGRCRDCGEPIRVRYPLVEAATAGLFVLAVLRQPPAEAVFVAAASAVLLAIAVIDLDTRRIPNVIVVPGTGIALVWTAAMGLALGRPRAIATAVGCGIAGFVLFLVIHLISPRGLGFGDVKLAAFIGMTSGWFGVAAWVTAIYGGFISGGLAAIGLLLLRRKGRKDAIPFAPALCFGGLLGLHLGGSAVSAWLG